MRAIAAGTALLLAAGAWAQPAQRAPTAAAQKALAQALNGDLAGEYQAVLMYRTYASLATGPARREMREEFQDALDDELEHAGTLADDIVALKGRPTTQVPPVPSAASNREMLQNALKAEDKAIDDYSQRIRQADAAGQTSIRLELEEILVDETHHRDDLEQMLEGAT